MAHPFNEHRNHKVEHSRVGKISRGYATGGSVHSDEAADIKLIKKKVKSSALKMDGGKVKSRMDRACRASGGRTKSRHGKGNTVNVIVAGGGGQQKPPIAGLAAPPPMPPMAAPPRPPMPQMPPPGAPGPGLPPPGGMPGMMGPRATGGRVNRNSGGRLNADADTAGIGKGRTPVQHADGKNDGRDIGRGPVITRKTGGPIYSPESATKGMAPKLDGGAGGGKARLEKPKRIMC